MIKDLANRGELQTSRARTRKALFTVTVLLACVVALGIVAGRSLSEESAACEQYGCADEPAQTQILSTEDTSGSHSASASASISTGASASASASSSAVAAEAGSVARPDTPAAFDPVASASASASASVGSEETPADESAPAASVPPEDSTSMEKNAEPDTTEHPTAKEPTSTRPLEFYPYGGKPCADRYCGIEGVDGSMECATYKTAAGQEIYGCANPNAYERRGCYEVTFYTTAGKPYNNMDTCSGEEVYAPPEPPAGAFQYWEPPNHPRDALDLYGHAVENCQFRGLLSYPDPYCKLKGNIPKNYDCLVFYDTAYGTVRGCAKAADLNGYNSERPVPCAERLQLYDEAGKVIDTVNSCPKIRTEECGKDQCGLRGVPEDWLCRRESWDFGELYGGERRTMRRCVDPRFEHYFENPYKRCETKRPIAKLYDERGRRVDSIPCSPGSSDGGLGQWAGFETDDAEKALGEDVKPPERDDPAGSGGVGDPALGNPDGEGQPSEESSAGGGEGSLGSILNVLGALFVGGYEVGSEDDPASIRRLTEDAYSMGDPEIVPVADFTSDGLHVSAPTGERSPVAALNEAAGGYETPVPGGASETPVQKVFRQHAQGLPGASGPKAEPPENTPTAPAAALAVSTQAPAGHPSEDPAEAEHQFGDRDGNGPVTGPPPVGSRVVPGLEIFKRANGTILFVAKKKQAEWGRMALPFLGLGVVGCILALLRESSE